MKSRWIAILALVALASALAVFVYLTPRSGERATFALSTLTAREVRQIRIVRGDRPAIVLERKDEAWQLSAPLAAPAEPFQVDRLLAILSARSPQRMPPIELARFDLEPAPLLVSFDAQKLEFGMVNPVTREQYVLTGGAVFVIEPRYAAGVPIDPMQLVRRRLLADDAVLARVELPELTIARGESGWTVTPARGGVSQDDLNRLADDWRLATATRVTEATARPALATVNIELKDGAAVALEIVQRDPVLVLRHRALQVEYTLSPASARRLLAVPGSAPR